MLTRTIVDTLLPPENSGISQNWVWQVHHAFRVPNDGPQGSVSWVFYICNDSTRGWHELLTTCWWVCCNDRISYHADHSLTLFFIISLRPLCLLQWIHCMSWINKRNECRTRDWVGFVGKLKQLSSLPWEVGELRNYSALHFVIVPFPLTCICHLTCSTNFSKTLGVKWLRSNSLYSNSRPCCKSTFYRLI